MSLNTIGTNPASIWKYYERYLSKRYNVLYEGVAQSAKKYVGTRSGYKNTKYYASIRGSGYWLLVGRAIGVKSFLANPYWGTETVNVTFGTGSANSWKDFDENTYAEYAIPAGASETTLVTWDLGSSAYRFIRVYFSTYTGGSSGQTCLYGSNDGSTWTNIFCTSTGSSSEYGVNDWYFLNYRYYKATCKSSSSSTQYCRLRTIEFYDPLVYNPTSGYQLQFTSDSDYNIEVSLVHDSSSAVYALLVELLGELIP